MLVHGRIADEPLATEALGAFFCLLVLAGNETTRNALSHGMVALTEWLEEKQRWIDALAGPQGDEVGWIAAEGDRALVQPGGPHETKRHPRHGAR